MKNADGDARFGLRFALIVAAFAMAPTLAFAYIDPGNGAYMVQALFTLAGAAIFYLRHPVRSLKAAWHWTLRRSKPTVDDVGGRESGLEEASGSPVDAATVSIQERS